MPQTPDRKYAPGGVVHAPDEDERIAQWFISNIGTSWYVISRGRAHRIVTEQVLDRWQAMALGSRLEPVEDDLASEASVTANQPSEAPGFLSRATSRVSHKIWASLVDVAVVVAVCGALFVVITNMPQACAQ